MTYIQQFVQDCLGTVPVGYEYLEYIAGFFVLVGIVVLSAFIIYVPLYLLKRLFK